MIANLLTSLRLLLVVPVAWALADPTLVAPMVLFTMLLAAIASDYFDGKLARRFNTASSKGMLFDHATDFLFVTAGLTGAALAGLTPLWLPILIAFAFSQYVIDSYWLYRQKELRMSFLGRWNGVFYFAPLVLIALSRLELLAPLSPLWTFLIPTLGYALVVSTLLSIADRAIAPLRSK